MADNRGKERRRLKQQADNALKQYLNESRIFGGSVNRVRMITDPDELARSMAQRKLYPASTIATSATQLRPVYRPGLTVRHGSGQWIESVMPAESQMLLQSGIHNALRALRPEEQFPIARHMTPSPFRGHRVQLAFDAWRLFTNTLSNNGRYITFDLEWLGNVNGDWVAPTEIAWSVFNQGRPSTTSYLMRLDSGTEKLMQDLIVKVQSGLSINADERRWLLDIMKYSDLQDANVLSPAQLATGRVLQHAQFNVQAGDPLSIYAPHMRRGLENLQRFGVDPMQPLTDFLDVYKHAYDTRTPVLSYNGLSADIRVLSTTLEKARDTVFPNNPDMVRSINMRLEQLRTQRDQHLDIYNIISSVFRDDPERLWEQYLGRELTDAERQQITGYLKQEELVENLFKLSAPGSAHQADVDTVNLGRLAADHRFIQILNGAIEESQRTAQAMASRMFEPSTKFFYDKAQLTPGSDLFWTRRGFIDPREDGEGTVATYRMYLDPSGKQTWRLVDPEYNGPVGGHRYVFEGIKAADVGEGGKYYTAILADAEDQIRHEISFRDRYDLINYLHRYSVPIDQITDDILNERRFRELDYARRTYTGFFEVGEKNFFRASQFYRAAARLGDSPTDADIIEALRFSNEIDTPASWVRDFKKLYPRLKQEAAAYNEAIDIFETAFLSGNNKGRRAKLMASEALTIFNQRMLTELGYDSRGPMELIERPASRRFGVTITHPFTGRQVEVNFNNHSFTSTLNAILSQSSRLETPDNYEYGKRRALQNIVNQLVGQGHLTEEEAQRVMARSTASSGVDVIASILAEKKPVLGPLEVPSIGLLDRDLPDINRVRSIALDVQREVARAWESRWTGKGINWSPEMQRWFQEQNDAILRFLPKELKDELRPKGNVVQESVERLVGALNQEGVTAQVFQNEHRNLVLAVMQAGQEQSVATAIAKGKWHEGLDNAIFLELPRIESGGRLINGRLNQLQVGITRQGPNAGKRWAKTLYEAVMDHLITASDVVARNVREGNLASAANYFNMIRNRALQHVPGGLGLFEDPRDYAMNSREDVASYLKLYHYQIDPSIREQIAQDYGLDPIRDELQIYQHLPQYMKENYGLSYDMSYGKQNWVQKGIIGSAEANVQDLFAWGYTIDTSRAAYRQNWSYNPIRKEYVEELSKQVAAGKTDILPGQFVTPRRADEILSQYGPGHVPGLDVKVALVTEADIRARIESLSPEERARYDAWAAEHGPLRVYEEQIMTSDTVAKYLWQDNVESKFGTGIHAIKDLRADIKEALDRNEELELQHGQVLGYDRKGRPVRYEAPAGRGTGKLIGMEQTDEGLISLRVRTELPPAQGMKVSVLGHKGINALIYDDWIKETFFGGADVVISPKYAYTPGGRTDSHIVATGLLEKFAQANADLLVRKDLQKKAEEVLLNAGTKVEITTQNIGGREFPKIYVEPRQNLNLGNLVEVIQSGFQGTGLRNVQLVEELQNGAKLVMVRGQIRRSLQDEHMHLTNAAGIDVDTLERRAAVRLSVREQEYLYGMGLTDTLQYIETVNRFQQQFLHGATWEEIAQENRELVRAWQASEGYLTLDDVRTLDNIGSPDANTVRRIPARPLNPNELLTLADIEGTVLDVEATGKNAFMLDMGMSEKAFPDERYRFLPVAPREVMIIGEGIGGDAEIALSESQKALQNVFRARDEYLRHYNERVDAEARMVWDPELQERRLREEADVRARYMQAVDEYREKLRYDATALKGSLYDSLTAELPSSAYSRLHIRFEDSDVPTAWLSPETAEALNIGADDWVMVGSNPSDRSSIQIARAVVDQGLEGRQIMVDYGTAAVLGRDSDADQIWVHAFNTKWTDMADPNNAEQMALARRLEALQDAARREMVQAQQSGTGYLGVYTAEEVQSLREPKSMQMKRGYEVYTVGEGALRDVVEMADLSDQQVNNLVWADTGIIRNAENRLRNLALTVFGPDTEKLAEIERIGDVMVQKAISGAKHKSGKVEVPWSNETRSTRLLSQSLREKDMSHLLDIFNAMVTDDKTKADLGRNEVRLINELLTLAGSDANSETLNLALSSGARKGFNIDEAFPTFYLSKMRQAMGDEVGANQVRQLMADYSSKAAMRSVPVNRVVDTAADAVKEVAAETSRNILGMLPAFGLGALAAWALPKFLSGGPMSIDQRPQTDMAPFPDGTYPTGPGTIVRPPKLPVNIRLMPTDSYKGIQINVRAIDLERISTDELSTLLSQAISQGSNMNLNMNINVRDNTSDFDRSAVEQMLSDLIGM